MGGADLPDAEIAENVDGVVGVKEGALTGNVRNVLNARRAKNSGCGVAKELIKCGQFLFLEIGYKHNRTRGDEEEEAVPIPSGGEDGVLEEAIEAPNGDNGDIIARGIHRLCYA